MDLFPILGGLIHTFEELDKIAYAKSDIEIAEIMQEKKKQLFKLFKQV